MNNDQLDRQIEELERFLHRDDPSLSKRFRQLERESTRNDVTVFSLLAISAVLLGIGVANLSLVAFCTGAAAFVASFLVDHLHQRKLDEPSRGETKESTWQ